MSDTVTFKGKLNPTRKSPLELAHDLNIDLYDFCGDDRCDDIVMEAIDWEFERKYILLNGKVYEHLYTEQTHSISYAQLNIDGTINYLVQFHNGGCGLDEAIQSTVKVCGIQ